MSLMNHITPVKDSISGSNTAEEPPGGDARVTAGNLAKLNLRLLDNSPYGIAIISPDTSLEYLNPALEKLTGLSRYDLLGQRAPYPFWPPDKRKSYFNLFNEMMVTEGLCSEMQLQRRNGESAWVEVTLSPLAENQAKYFVINHIDLTERRKMREETEFYVREITRIQEEERKRIARELHDDTAQSLAFITLELDSLIHNSEIVSEKVRQRLTNLRLQAENSLTEVRRFSHELRPGVLDQLGLLAALETLVDETRARGQFFISFSTNGTPRRLSNEEEQALFRIVQEALSNVRKHSQATAAGVRIDFSRQKVKLSISDNGKGFPSQEVNRALSTGRLGLIGMKERARLIGGRLLIKSVPHEGTTVMVEIEAKPKNLKTFYPVS